ncbi:hypothetical protein GCM10010275_19590 [Streptomyces litmocidini]|nr:hypothetical protein GCM10010275_19590 [Streptomyces litmocidini]
MLSFAFSDTGCLSGWGPVDPWRGLLLLRSRAVLIRRRRGREEDQQGYPYGLRYGLRGVGFDMPALTGQQVTYERVVATDLGGESAGREGDSPSRVVHDPPEGLLAAEFITHSHRLPIGTVRLSV